jgi:hypothetical protein
VVCVLGGVVVCSAGVVVCPLGGVVVCSAGVVVWVAGGVVVWLAGAVVVGALGDAVVCGAVVCGLGCSVVCGAADVAGAAVVCGAAVVAGAAVLAGAALVSGACGLCGPPPGPPGPPWQLPPGQGGGGSSGKALANPGFNAEMLSPAASASALTRFLDDIAASPLGPGPDDVWLGPRYGQVRSISNGLVTVCGWSGLVMSVPVAVPLIA